MHITILLLAFVFQPQATDAKEADLDLIARYPQVMDSDPIFPKPKLIFVQSEKLVPLWLKVFGQDEDDAKREAALAIGRAFEEKVPGTESAIRGGR